MDDLASRAQLLRLRAQAQHLFKAPINKYSQIGQVRLNADESDRTDASEAIDPVDKQH